MIRKRKRHFNGASAIYDCRQHIWPVTHEELSKIALTWVDAALRIEEKDMKMMHRLLTSQRAQHGQGRSVQGKGSHSELMAA
jgi:DSF synthase